MKKEKTDYFKELEKFSECCLLAVKRENVDFDSINELKNLTEGLKKEYFTPIEREDIFLLASSLSDIYLSLTRFYNFADKTKRADMLTLSNFLYSAISKINETVTEISKFPKSNIYVFALEIKNITAKALSIAVTLTDTLTEIFKDCINKCEIFAEKIIYIQLKNT